MIFPAGVIPVNIVQIRAGRAGVGASVLFWLGVVVLTGRLPGPAFAQEEVSFRSGDDTLKSILVLPKTHLLSLRIKGSPVMRWVWVGPPRA
jgi:hypothetical protein